MFSYALRIRFQFFDKKRGSMDWVFGDQKDTVPWSHANCFNLAWYVCSLVLLLRNNSLKSISMLWRNTKTKNVHSRCLCTTSIRLLHHWDRTHLLLACTTYNNCSLWKKHTATAAILSAKNVIPFCTTNHIYFKLQRWLEDEKNQYITVDWNS